MARAKVRWVEGLQFVGSPPSNHAITLDGSEKGGGADSAIHPGELLIWWSVPGDANADSLVNGSDIVFLINYLFGGGAEPCVMEAADPNGDCKVDSADVVYLLNYLFRGGSPPEPGCAH